MNEQNIITTQNPNVLIYNGDEFINYRNQQNLIASKEDIIEATAKELHNISKNNKAILERPISHYKNMLYNNLIVVAYDYQKEEIIGSGGFLCYDNIDRGEVSGIYVNHDYSGQKIGNAIVQSINNLGKTHNKNLLLTMKPNEKDSSGMIIDATRNGYLPVSYSYLCNIKEAMNQCCVCEEGEGSPNCSARDKYCVLGVQNIGTEVVENCMRYISSPEYKEAIRDTLLRKKIETNIKNELNNLTDDEKNNIYWKLIQTNDEIFYNLINADEPIFST